MTFDEVGAPTRLSGGPSPTTNIPVVHTLLMGAVAHGDYFFPKKFEFVSLCSFICLQAVYQLSGPVCKA